MTNQRRTRPSRPIAVAALLLAAATHALAQPVLLQNDKLLPGGAAGDEFGVAAALSGDVAVIGAPGTEGFFLNSGAAYIYRRVGGVWSEEEMVAADLGNHDRFGTAVAVDGDVVVVGSRERGFDDAGAAYVYRYDAGSWELEDTLTASDAAPGNWFGASVAVSGGVIVVGAPLGEGNFTDAGAAYVFRGDGLGAWTQEAKLVAPDGSGYAEFGATVAVLGETAVISAPSRAGGGAIYVAQNSGGWSTGSAYAPVGISGTDRFGAALSFDGTRAIVGVPEDDSSGLVTNSGSAFILGWNGAAWVQEAMLVLPTPVTDDYYGFSVDICGSRAIVGAYSTGHSALTDPGSAHVYWFDGTDWEPEVDLNASDAADSDYFGYSVAVCETAIVGAYRDDPTGSAGLVGSAYVFELGPVGPVDSDNDGLTDAEEILLGTNPNLSDTDGDGLSDSAEVLTHLTNPLAADTDTDGLSDSAEIATHFTNPLDDDSDDDDLTDGAEVATHTTNPLNPDTDGDSLTDGEEVALQDFGSCPSPLLMDSDNDGLTDDVEVEWLPMLDPCDMDFDDDGLSDGNEGLFGTDPADPDTDGDGLLDGTEVDMALGGPCPDPVLADSDGDTLLDGDELSAGTSLCNTDTDGDEAIDPIDPTPTVPGVTASAIEDWLRETSEEVLTLNLSLFDAPNNNAAWGRRLVMALELQIAANATARDQYQLAVLTLEIMRRRIDEGPSPKDWMIPSPEKTQLRGDVDLLISWLHYEM